jgi:hypothetical protein
MARLNVVVDPSERFYWFFAFAGFLDCSQKGQKYPTARQGSLNLPWHSSSYSWNRSYEWQLLMSLTVAKCFPKRRIETISMCVSLP